MGGTLWSRERSSTSTSSTRDSETKGSGTTSTRQKQNWRPFTTGTHTSTPTGTTFFTRFELLDCKRFGILFDSPLDSPTSSGGDSGRVSPDFDGGGGATSLLSSRARPNSNRRNRTLSMNLENFQDPIWRQTGRDLQVHKKNFNPLRKLLTLKSLLFSAYLEASRLVASLVA